MKYGMSMLENLEFIRLQGLPAFIEKEEKYWQCPKCGGTICVHKHRCSSCDEPFASDESSSPMVPHDPIHKAAKAGDVAKAKAFLEGNPKKVSKKDSNGESPLHYAAQFGTMDAAALLLSKGAEVNTKRNDGNTPLDMAVASGHKDMVEFLRQHGGHE
jgi:ankyrin repeat protein